MPTRVYIWDAEEDYGLLSGYSPTLGLFTLNQDRVLQGLRSSPDFSLLLADRIRRHLYDNGVLTRDQVVTRLRAWADSTRQAFIPHSARWGNTLGGEHRFLGDSPLGRYDTNRATLESFVHERTDDMVEHLEAGVYLPRTPYPTFNRYRGEVAAGFTLEAHASQGDVFITTDGLDPRNPANGSPTITARQMSSPAELRISKTTHVKARALSDGVWSALTEAVLLVSHDVSGLRISELMYHPRPPPDATDATQPEDFEWIELHNASAAPVQLRGLYFCDGITFRFAEHRVLPPGGRLVLAKPGPSFDSRYPETIPAGTFAGSLSNGGERLALCNTSGEVIVELNYDDVTPWPIEADGEGYSLVLDDHTNPGAAESWRLSTAIDGSPGLAD